MQKKILLISEALDVPFDEGIKNIVASLYKQLEARNNVFLATKEGNKTGGIKVMKTNLNKLFLSASLKSLLKKCAPDVVLYIPLASCSFYSFIRAKMLKLMLNNIKVVLLCVQRREYSSAQSGIMTKFLKPDLVLLLGKMDESFFLKNNIKVKVLPPAIDTVRFCPPRENEKKRMRTEFGIPNNKKLFLHVGHIKKNRNLECFFDIQKHENAQVVIVASSAWGEDVGLGNKLKAAGIRIINNFIPDMSRIYKMSDAYVFPVLDKTGATDMPLSVLEAMACNLPVITTRYGGLVDFFRQDDGFKYFDTKEELLEIIKDIGNSEVSNYTKVESFTWENFANEVISACKGL